MKIKLFIIIQALLPLFVSAQDILEFGSGFNQTGTIKGCEGIVLKPGFKFTAASGRTLNLQIDAQVCSPYATKEINISEDRNYILSITPTTETDVLDITGNEIEIARGASYLTSVQYFDGLGRPDQLTQIGISPRGKDHISYTEYDSFGREYRQTLPQIEGYSYGDQRTFTETRYEPSPLNRAVEQQGPGAAWAGHPVNTEYEVNETNEVKYFYVNNSGNLARSLFYASGVLYKTKTTDEDGKSIIEFTNKLGQTVMVRRESNVDTYYVYDEYGNLRYVLPPAATALGDGSFSDSNSTLILYAYVYKYDYRNRLIEKRLPGCDWVYMVYDKADRLIMSQDGNQRAKRDSQGRFAFTLYKYDDLGRMLYSSEIYTAAGADYWRPLFKDKLVTESFTINSSQPYPVEDTGYSKGWFYGDYPMQLLTVNYYDSYHFLDLPVYYGHTWLRFVLKNDYDREYYNAKGMLTGTRTYLLDGSNSYITTSYFYDSRGRVVQTHSTNLVGGYDIVYHKYDFTGNILKTLNEHSIYSSHTSPMTESYTYTYDHAGRLIDTKYKLNNATEVVLSHNEYDEPGRLITKKQHNQINAIQYEYNIRNWLTRVQDNTFEQKIYYNNDPDGATPYYSGNISSIYWTHNGLGNKYRFTYDNLNRLENSSLTMLRGSTSNIASCYTENMTYDNQGNITTLQRTTELGNPIDNLVFTYSGNQITKIRDQVNNIYLYMDMDLEPYNIKEYRNENTPTTTREFYYDKNGNMTTDLDREIATIRYNLLNLPDTIQFSTGSQIINTYDASGRKLKTEYLTAMEGPAVPISTIKKLQTSQIVERSGTLYNGNIEYNTTSSGGRGTVKRIHNTEGYTDGITSINSNSGNYNYFRKDHLGNNREVWRVSNGVAQTIQRTQYYPSGLPWLERKDENISSQPYKYNGKEYIEDHGLDEYDYHARGMYPAVMRFTTIDPLAEKYYSFSPYAYCANNPMKFIDPDGKDYILSIDQENGIIAIYATYYASSQDITVAEEAIDYWNNQSGNFTFETGKSGNYTIEFFLMAVEVETDPSMTSNQMERAVKSAATMDRSGGGNAFVVVEDSRLAENTNGVTRGGNLVEVKNSRKNTDTGAHEVGHTLGLTHSLTGIMTASSIDKNRKTTINTSGMGEMLKYPLKGKVNYENGNKAGKATIRHSYPSRDYNFHLPSVKTRGKIKK